MADNEDFITMHKADGSSYQVPLSKLEGDVLDLHERNIKPAMLPTYRATALKIYHDTDKILNKYLELLNGIDVKDRLQVGKKALEINSKLVNEGFSSRGMSCYRYAAIVANIFKRKGIKYTCYAGGAYPYNTPELSYMKKRHLEGTLGANHVWLDALGTRYEYFNGKLSGILHFTWNDKIDFEK